MCVRRSWRRRNGIQIRCHDSDLDLAGCGGECVVLELFVSLETVPVDTSGASGASGASGVSCLARPFNN
jgi:hypothetical protein